MSCIKGLFCLHIKSAPVAMPDEGSHIYFQIKVHIFNNDSN